MRRTVEILRDTVKSHLGSPVKPHHRFRGRSFKDRLIYVIPEYLRYAAGVGVFFGGWYGLSWWVKSNIPKDQRFPKKMFLTNCSVRADTLVDDASDLPSPALLADLGRTYGFSLAQAAWASSHFCPIEFHVHLVEHLVSRRLGEPLKTILATSERSPSPARLAQLVGDLIERELDKLATSFPTAACLKNVPLEAHLQAACDRLESSSELQQLPLQQRVQILQETVRHVFYEFLVANWEASRYFDSFTYREGFFGPRRALLTEGEHTGTRGSSYLCLDKPWLRVDAFEWARPLLHKRRDTVLSLERNADRSYLSLPSLDSLRTMAEQRMLGKMPPDESEIFKKQRREGGKNFLRSPNDSLRGTTLLKTLPNEEDPFQTFLSSDEFGPHSFKSLDEIADVVNIIRKYGMVRLRAAIPAEAILHVKRKLFVSPLSGADTVAKINQVDLNAEGSRRSFGRVTAFLRGTSFEPFLVELQRLWMPVLYAYFPTEQYFGSRAASELVEKSKGRIHDWDRHRRVLSEDDDGSEDNEHRMQPVVTEIPSKRLFCSAIQLTVQERNCPEEGFAVDNAAPSFTVLIALDDMKFGQGSSGALQLIPGSHHIGTMKEGRKHRSMLSRNWRDFWNVFFEANGPVNVMLKAGDVLIWDSRLFRRCHGNVALATSSYLLFRYDFPDTPPPSQGMLQLFSNKLKSLLLYWLGLVTRSAFNDLPEPVAVKP